jgi:2-amino-4-hydroxy-6-hydroxymethyldihydropteridine diphosphokinase
MTATYALALGANRRGHHGAPADEVRASLAAIGDVLAVSPIIVTPPLGPSIRRFANAAALIASDEPPPALLARLKAIEAAFGRRAGRRWGARVIDLDIILWSGGAFAGPGLIIPHSLFRERSFVLEPLARIAPDWRDPLTGRTIRQLARRLEKRRPADAASR